MDTVAKQLSTSAMAFALATVKSNLEGRYVTADEFGRISKAKKATACLVTPKVGDQVLIADVGRETYVLSVLERDGEADTQIDLEGDTTLSVRQGKLSVSATDGLSLATSEELTLLANRLGLAGETLDAAFRKINLFGDAVETRLNDIKLFSKRLESKVDSAIQRFVRRHAKVEGLDSVKAGSIKQTAKDILNLRSAFAFFKAKNNVKIDGKQILMG